MKRNSSSPRPVTILEVAAVAKVSKSTVSLVLKDSPLIPAETSERVREAAAKLGYVYNRRAGQMRGGSSNTIAVVINDLMNPFFAEILVGVERKLVDAGYIVLMAHTNEDVDRQHLMWEADDAEGGHGNSAHGVAIAQRVGGGDRPEIPRVIDDRGEEIDRLHERQLVADLVHAGVVPGLVADEDLRVALHRREMLDDMG